jgi:thiol-disulfide isomerase/thioredoxin
MSRRRYLSSLALLLALLAAPARAGTIRVGDRAPEFTLSAWDGGPLALTELRGHVVCLDFWATWCATCKTALPALDAIARRHGDAVRVLGVNIDAERAPADRFLEQYLPRRALTLARDPGGSLLARYGAAGMPALYLIDRDGIVRHVESGYDATALERVDRALGELSRGP